jgi:hypothetical protein
MQAPGILRCPPWRDRAEETEDGLEDLLRRVDPEEVVHRLKNRAARLTAELERKLDQAIADVFFDLGGRHGLGHLRFSWTTLL